MIRIFYLVALTVLTASCESFYIDSSIDCDYCFYDRFDSTDLIIHTSFTDVDSVFLEVYTDTPEEGDLIFASFIDRDTEYVWVEVNKRYSAQAYYFFNNDSLLAKDGTKPRRIRVTETCGDECYATTNEEIDLTVKYWK